MALGRSPYILCRPNPDVKASLLPFFNTCQLPTHEFVETISRNINWGLEPAGTAGKREEVPFLRPSFRLQGRIPSTTESLSVSHYQHFLFQNRVFDCAVASNSFCTSEPWP